MFRFARALGVGAALLAVSGPLTAQQAVNLPAADRAIQPRLDEIYKVGKIDGAAWELFGNRVETAFDGAGNLYVFDPDNFRVVVVSPTGGLLRQIGKRGEGPGELRSPSGFTVFRDGTVAIADIAQRSFLLFDRSGAFQRSVTFASGDVVTLGALLGDPRGGSVLSVGRRVFMMTQSGPGGPQGPPAGRPIVRFPLAEGSQSRQIHNAWEAPPAAAVQSSVTGGRAGGGITISAPPTRAFEPALFAGVLPDGGVAFSDSSAYAIRVLGPDGGVQRVIRRPLRPQAVTPAIERAERERRLAELSAGGGPQMRMMVDGPGGGGAQPVPQEQIQAMQRDRINQMTFFPEVPIVTGLTAGWAGKIWVGRQGSPMSDPGPIDILTATGEYLGTIAANGVRMPSAFGPDGLVAHIERDQFEVVSVRVRRLPTELR